MAKKKFDIFTVLDRINNCDLDYIDKFSDEELKEFQPFVVMLWTRGAIDNRLYHTYLTNELCNKHMFSLGKHPRLLYKLLCAANGFGDGTRYKFLKADKKKSNKKEINLLCEYYGYTPKQAEEALSLLDDGDILEIAKEMGQEKV